MSLRIRDAGTDDLAQVLLLNRRFERVTSPLDEARLGRLHAAAARHRVAVLEADGRCVVAGFLLALREGADYDSPNYRWFAARAARFLYVDRVVVDAPGQGRGLGAALYEDLIAWARSQGIGLLACEFDVDPPNEASARLHARFGFRELGRQVLPGGKTVSMQGLRLAPEGAPG